MGSAISRRDFTKWLSAIGFGSIFLGSPIGMAPHLSLKKGRAQSIFQVASQAEDATISSFMPLSSWPWEMSLNSTLLRTIISVDDAGVRFGQGEIPLLRNELTKNGNIPILSQDTRSIACFLQITDTHVTDEESPARLNYRRFAGFSPYILNAAVKTIRKVSSVINLDFILHTGDAIEGAQQNEIEWFLQTLDGKQNVDPDSGAKVESEGHFSGPKNAPFYAPGLPEVPWYMTLGNHDQLVMGIFKRTGNFNNLAMGGFAPLGYKTILPVDVPILGKSLPFELRGVPITADQRRYILDKQELIMKFFESATSPKGHGFAKESIESEAGFYTMEPISDIPLVFIVLDSTNPVGFSTGSLSSTQFDLLKNALQISKKEEKLAILISHHPSEEITDTLPMEGTRSKNGQDLINLLNQFPNAIAHVCGHTHENKITTKETYYEIQTAALIDPPHQMRLIEVLWHGNTQISIVGTMLDFEDDTELTIQGRIQASQDSLVRKGFGTRADRNVVCTIDIPKNIVNALTKSNVKSPRLLHV